MEGAAMSVVPFKSKAQSPLGDEPLMRALAASLRGSADLEHMLMASTLPEATKVAALSDVMAATQRLFSAHLLALRTLRSVRP
jgi:hypothetical protein